MTDTSKEAVERCEAGCVAYHGGERRHHKDCVFYPESMTKMLDDCLAELDEAKAEIERLRADRPFIIGFVEGFDVAVKECEALVREKFEKCRKVSMTYTGLDAASDISDLKGTSDD